MIRSILFLCCIIGFCQSFKLQSKISLIYNNKTISMNNQLNLSKYLQKAAIAVVSSTLLINPVLAANYGGFGSTYSAVVDPKNAVLLDGAKDSEDFKTGYSGLLKLIDLVKDVESKFAKDDQLDLGSIIKTDFNIASLRTTLNKFNSAFDEDTQKGTDRLIRNILQDITELERESFIRSGKSRTDFKKQSVTKRLTATETALKELAAFYPSK